MRLEELRDNPEILKNLDWEMTPQDALQMYQLKSVDNYKHRDLPQVYFFYVDVWRGEVRLVLVKREFRHAQEVAEIPMDRNLLLKCIEKLGGSPESAGQYPIDEAIRARLARGLGLKH